MGDPSDFGLTDNDRNFVANDAKKDADKPIENDGSFESKKDQVINSILSGELPGISSFPLMSHPDLNKLGTHILRIIYPKLTERPDGISKEMSNDLLDRKKEFLRQFADKVQETGVPLKYWREQGESCFHLGNEKGLKSVEDGFAYYYNKSRAEWRPYEGEVARAYLTIKPELATKTPEQFVGLVNFLRDAGVDFYAKAGSPWHAAQRLDDFVFYISPNDVDRTRELFRDYIGDKEIFEGAVLSADADKSIKGVSWGKEPTAEDVEAWQKATGDRRERISYSQAMAFQMAPSAFVAIARKYAKNGQAEEGKKFAVLAAQAQNGLTKEDHDEGNKPDTLHQDTPAVEEVPQQEEDNPKADEKPEEEIAPPQDQEAELEFRKWEGVIAKNRKFLELAGSAINRARTICDDVPLREIWARPLNSLNEDGLAKIKININTMHTNLDDLHRANISVNTGEQSLNRKARLTEKLDQLRGDWKIFERNTQECMDFIRRLSSKARDLTGDRLDNDNPIYKIGKILDAILAECPNMKRTLDTEN